MSRYPYYDYSSVTENHREVTMCLFSTPSQKHRKHRYVEEVYVAPRPVSRHSHHHHHGHNGRASYNSVTRVTTTTPRMSQNSFRRSVPTSGTEVLMMKMVIGFMCTNMAVRLWGKVLEELGLGVWIGGAF
ncbi:hypothetical protein BDZ45DRAFT_741033 [Acephala macrosclerotiorum]|nr:hypothetical protein BDZ45DRAFT_741033 [Acephala macrosclerotiorum]